MDITNTLASYLPWAAEEQQNAPSSENAKPQSKSDFSSRYSKHISAETRYPRPPTIEGTVYESYVHLRQCFPKDPDAPTLDRLKLAIRDFLGLRSNEINDPEEANDFDYMMTIWMALNNGGYVRTFFDITPEMVAAYKARDRDKQLDALEIMVAGGAMDTEDTCRRYKPMSTLVYDEKMQAYMKEVETIQAREECAAPNADLLGQQERSWNWLIKNSDRMI